MLPLWMKTGRTAVAAAAIALIGVLAVVYVMVKPADTRPTANALSPSPFSPLPDGPFQDLTPSASESGAVGLAPSPSRSPSAKPSPSRSSKPPLVPSASSSQWVYGTVSRPIVGSSGTLLRYRVAVERVSGQNPDSFGANVHSTLGGARGWTHAGQWRFQQVTSGPVNFTIWLATPTTTDRICGQYGIHTEGEVSCRGGKDVVINLKRWTQGSPTYPDPSLYRHLVVNHEVGHFLGHGHVSCPGTGKLAPVMQTQFYGMNGCVPNIWPYTEDGTYVD